MLANGFHASWPGDFIDSFLSHTENKISPYVHRLWSAIACVGGALERRVWARAGDYVIFPNLYVMLVAPPGTGKHIIEDVRELWSSTSSGGGAPKFQVAPDSVSRASLIDAIKSAGTSFTFSKSKPPVRYHSLLVASEEFEVILPSYDAPFISILNKIWNNDPFHRETRRHGPAIDVRIENPQLNILAGATPSYFTAHFPEEAWATGLIRRIVLVYAEKPPFVDIFQKGPPREHSRATLLQQLLQMSTLWGEATWEPAAFASIRDWANSSGENVGGPPVPTHSKLAYYCRSRTMLAVKLSLISAVARSGLPQITLADTERGVKWLLDAERLMPDIFRAMTGKSDAQIIEELHYYLQSAWISNKQKPIIGAKIREFLSYRVTHEKVEGIFRLAESIDAIARAAGAADLWIPRPKFLHGVE